MTIQGVIFDLDGVLVSTDEMHFQGWKRLADELGIPFDRLQNERCRGVNRMQSLEVVLERAEGIYTDQQKAEFAERKNGYYKQLLTQLQPGDTLPGAEDTLRGLRGRGIRTAIASASRNAPTIVAAVGIGDLIDQLVDGNHTSRSKPDPEVFVLAAERLGLAPEACLVVEDAVAGVEAARRAGMAVLGIGTPESLPGVVDLAENLAAIGLDELLSIQRRPDPTRA